MARKSTQLSPSLTPTLGTVGRYIAIRLEICSERARRLKSCGLRAMITDKFGIIINALLDEVPPLRRIIITRRALVRPLKWWWRRHWGGRAREGSLF